MASPSPSPDADGRFDEIEAAAVVSIYAHAVAESGFDPLTELKKARQNSKHSERWSSHAG
jgi:hypothetical protein